MPDGRRGAGWAPGVQCLLIAFALAGCGGAGAAGGDHGAAVQARPAEAVADSLDAVANTIAAQGAYRVEPVSKPGTIAGRIRMDSAPPRHDLVLTGPDTAACGARIPDGSFTGSGNNLQGALVWIADIHAGAGLPRLRRASLQIVNCRFVPRVMAVAQGTTINLQSRDDAVHRTRFFSESGDSLLSRMLTVDRWAVVPSARIAAQPGLVRVRLTRHPFIRGFIAVFQHPYFAVTDAAGRYRITGLPPGTYQVRVWHERGGEPLTRVIRVAAGALVTFDTSLALH